ncbi:MAG: cupin domain-containing protein [Gemmatimonadetes bacterium]|nr:cupin domain-containing protein [Gemmatimonadota bacterium]
MKVSAADTDGALALFHLVAPPGMSGPLPHAHSREDEVFYVLTGELVFEIDGQETVGAGGPSSSSAASRIATRTSPIATPRS